MSLLLIPFNLALAFFCLVAAYGGWKLRKEFPAAFFKRDRVMFLSLLGVAALAIVNCFI